MKVVSPAGFIFPPSNTLGTSDLIFGDGRDGTATFNGSNTVTGATRVGSVYTLTRNVFYNSVTISSTVTVKTGGFKLFCKGTFTNNGGVIHADGIPGDSSGIGGAGITGDFYASGPGGTGSTGAGLSGGSNGALFNGTGASGGGG